MLQVNPKQIPGGTGGGNSGGSGASDAQPLGTVPQPSKMKMEHGRKAPKGKKHKHCKYILVELVY